MKNLLPLLTLFISTLTIAQVNVNATPVVDTDDSKTVFIYRDSDAPSLETLTKILKENWTYNPIELVSLKEFADYEMQENDFVFTIEYNHASSTTTYTNGTTGAVSHFVDFYLQLSQKTATGYTQHARVILSVSGATIIDVCRTTKTAEEIIRNQYTSSTIFSWNYAYLGTALHLISENLGEKAAFASFDAAASASLRGLKNKTLYIADGVEIKQNRFNGKEKRKNVEKGIDKSYDYSFEIVSNERLNEIADKDEDGYVFMFQKVGRGKICLVVDLSAKEIIYQKMVPNKYKFKKKDIRKLNKALVKQG